MRHRGHAQLFTTWLVRRDEASFRALCERHAPVVHSACARLGAPDADEAAQAVFIVMAQRPEAVGDPTRLVGWLLGTARRVVANQRRGEERRRRHEQEAAMEHTRQRAEDADPAWADARPLLDEALASLSAARREAMVRFYLEGRPQALVARELGCSIDAVKTRVHESLALLRRWFARRGVTLGLATLATGLASEASAANPALVIACTKAGLVPTAAPAAAALAKSVAPVMALSLTTATTAAAVILGSSLVAAMVLGIDRKAAPSVLAPASVAASVAESTAVPALAPAPGALNAQTFWYGNTWGGGSGPGAAYFQQNVDDIVVHGKRIYAITPWDEHAGEASIYTTDGDKVGVPEAQGDWAAQFHSWGWSGGTALATDGTFVWYAVGQNGEAGQGKFAGVARYALDGAAAKWDGATLGHRLKLAGGGKPPGLAVHAGELFVSDPASGRIQVFSTTTMKPLRSMPCADPGRLLIGAVPESALWVINTAAKQVRKLGRDGKDLGVTISDCSLPVALALDRDGSLLVADGALDRQCIRRYRADGRFTGDSFGGPIYRGDKPGLVEPGRFFRITGIATDSEGALYVACWDYGAKLHKYDAMRKPVWMRQGTEFVSCADADPGEEGTLYSVGHRYAMDFTKPPAQAWRDVAITLDPLRYPLDPRLQTPWQAMRVLRLGGQRILVGKQQMSGNWYFWRFLGEIAVPAAMYFPEGAKSNEYPPNHPERGAFMWIDADGDGAMQAGEYHSAPDSGQCTALDASGALLMNVGGWDAGKGRIARLPFAGLNTTGAPTWDLAKRTEVVLPAVGGLEKASKIAYDSEHDRMYIGAWSTEHPFPGGGWEQMNTGPVLFCFDTWSKQPTLTWSRVLIPPEGIIGAVPKAWSLERDYLFIASTWKHEQLAVDVWRLADGERVGRLLPTADIAGVTGWIDMNDAVQTHRRADGTYLICVEEVWMAKGLVFLWKP